jgi:hypothetical protein
MVFDVEEAMVEEAMVVDVEEAIVFDVEEATGNGGRRQRCWMCWVLEVLDSTEGGGNGVGGVGCWMCWIQRREEAMVLEVLDVIRRKL